MTSYSAHVVFFSGNPHLRNTIGIAHISPIALHTLHDGQIAHLITQGLQENCSHSLLHPSPPPSCSSQANSLLPLSPYHICRIQFRVNINVVKNLPKKTALVKAFQHLWSLLVFLWAQNQISSKGVRSDQINLKLPNSQNSVIQ